MDVDPTTEEREAWRQAFGQSLHDWRLWERWNEIEDARCGVEPKRRYEFAHYLEFEHFRALAREKLADGETETWIDRIVNEQRSRNEQFPNLLHELQGKLATMTEEFHQEQQRKWHIRLQIVVFAALGLAVFFGLIRAYWQ